MKTILNKDLFRPDEVASFFSVTRKTIYCWINEGILTSVKVGGVTRITRKSIAKCQKVSL